MFIFYTSCVLSLYLDSITGIAMSVATHLSVANTPTRQSVATPLSVAVLAFQAVATPPPDATLNAPAPSAPELQQLM